jgi:hypothetical protein
MWLSFRRGGFRRNPAARTAASENDEK